MKPAPELQISTVALAARSPFSRIRAATSPVTSIMSALPPVPGSSTAGGAQL